MSLILFFSGAAIMSLGVISESHLTSFGVLSEAQAKIKAMGDPISSAIITKLGTHSGRAIWGMTVSTT